MLNKSKSRIGIAALLLGIGVCQSLTAGSPDDLNRIKIAPGQILFELVGEGFNLTPPASAQIGYFTYIKGVNPVFAGVPEDVTTALFTYYRDTVNVSSTANGPLRIISRKGTTTIYLNSTPGADLANPDSFRAGAPILVSTFRQQAIIDTLSQTFTIVDEDTITSTSAFSVNGVSYRLGKMGDVYRTMRTGHLNSPGSSLAGWLAGYSVGAAAAGTSDQD